MLTICLTVLAILLCAALEEVYAKRPDKPALTLAVRPLVMLTRGDISAQIRVAASERNRAMVLSWTSDYGTAGSTVKQVDGENGPVLFRIELPAQPPANYEFTATLFGEQSKRLASASAVIRTPDNGGQR